MTNKAVRNIQRAESDLIDALGSIGVATIHEAQGRTGYLGAEIRFTDIEGPSMLWDVDGVAQAIAEDPKVKALLPVHVAGQAVDMEGLLQVAEGRPIVEDAAHALPTHAPASHPSSV